MTIIVWDGHTLAADRQLTVDGCRQSTLKIHRINGCLVGGAGDWPVVQELMEWLEKGADPAAFRILPKCEGGLLVIHPNGTVHFYDNLPYPGTFTEGCAAIGSESMAAMCLLDMGHDAKRIVEAINNRSTSCGLGVDTLQF